MPPRSAYSHADNDGSSGTRVLPLLVLAAEDVPQGDPDDLTDPELVAEFDVRRDHWESAREGHAAGPLLIICLQSELLVVTLRDLAAVEDRPGLSVGLTCSKAQRVSLKMELATASPQYRTWSAGRSLALDDTIEANLLQRLQDICDAARDGAPHAGVALLEWAEVFDSLFTGS